MVGNETISGGKKTKTLRLRFRANPRTKSLRASESAQPTASTHGTMSGRHDAVVLSHRASVPVSMCIAHSQREGSMGSSVRPGETMDAQPRSDSPPVDDGGCTAVALVALVACLLATRLLRLIRLPSVMAAVLPRKGSARRQSALAPSRTVEQQYHRITGADASEAEGSQMRRT